MENTIRFCILSASRMSMFILSIIVACSSPAYDDEEWDVPSSAHLLNNPFSTNNDAFEKGKKLYQLYCRSCHGKTGMGDGPARGPLGMKPSNFHREKVKKQTNGDLFWKISTGRKDMPAFGKSLSEEQRWQLVTFIRNMPDKPELELPLALRRDIKVQHFMSVHAQAVRILEHPKTKDLWYTTFNGDVYRIGKIKNNQPVPEKIFSTGDHGIAILQGATFLHNNTLLL